MPAPLAERMRPKSLSAYVGQKHILNENQFLFKSIKQGYIPSMLLWGPPGVGKTTLAEVISKEINCTFFSLSAINAGVKEVRDVIDKARNPNLLSVGIPILFIDEIHRFSKSQQDSLLAAVEKGWITLIGATTENPSFEVIPALRSRCQLFVLEQLEVNDLNLLLKTALETDVLIANKKLILNETDALIRISGGDARKLLNGLEIVANFVDTGTVITNQLVTSVIQHNLAMYDKGGEEHYNVISAFIKSIRGSDPNASVYWLARMLTGGEDPKFIARRMVILASEDIGLANANALLMATNCMQAVHLIGMPESRIILSNCAIYLAISDKSNSAYVAIETALELATKTANEPVPLALRNAPTKLMKELNYGLGYGYSHNGEDNFIAQNFLIDSLKGECIYKPGNNKKEMEMRLTLQKQWKDYYNYEQ